MEGMTGIRPLPPDHRATLARRLAAALTRRAALNEGIGVLQSWHSCSSGQARRDLYETYGPSGQNAEAARVVAVVNAAAQPHSDPDWD